METPAPNRRYIGMFPYEKFGPYKAAIEFIALAHKICSELPRGHFELADQLKRAASSICLNVAEGSGRTTKAEAKRFYAIARGSAMECAAILDVLTQLSLLPAPSRDAGRDRLRSIVAILTSICRQ